MSTPVDRQRLIALYEERLGLDPGSRVFLPLADLYRRDDRPADARRVLDAGLKRHPGFISALVAMAQLLAAEGDDEGSAPLLGRILERDSDNLVALCLAAAAAERLQQWARAATHLERILRLDPGNEEVLARLRGVRARIVATAESAPVRPDGAAVCLASGGVATVTLADLYLRQGHLDKAREILVRMAAADPGRGDVQERLLGLDAVQSDPAGAESVEPARRRTAAERNEEQQRFAAWVERAGAQDGT